MSENVAIVTEEFKFDISIVLLIAGMAIVTSSVSELISWLFLYRKDQYKYLKSEIERLNKKKQKIENTHVIQEQKKAHDKKLAVTEKTLKSSNQQMTFLSLKSNLVVGLLMIGVINMIGTYFQGMVIAKLPFEPFSLVRPMFHRNIKGEDYTQAAYLPIYIMVAFIWRSNIKKIFGFQPPKAAVSFFDPPKYKPE